MSSGKRSQFLACGLSRENTSGLPNLNKDNVSSQIFLVLVLCVRWCSMVYNRLPHIVKLSKPSERSERGFGSLEWRQPEDVGAYAWPYAWPNLHETFRSCWGMVGEWPRQKNKFFRWPWNFFVFLRFFLYFRPNWSLIVGRLSRLWGLSLCDTST